MGDQCLLPLVKRLLGLGHLIKSIDAYSETDIEQVSIAQKRVILP